MTDAERIRQLEDELTRTQEIAVERWERLERNSRVTLAMILATVGQPVRVPRSLVLDVDALQIIKTEDFENDALVYQVRRAHLNDFPAEVRCPDDN